MPKRTKLNITIPVPIEQKSQLDLVVQELTQAFPSEGAWTYQRVTAYALFCLLELSERKRNASL